MVTNNTPLTLFGFGVERRRFIALGIIAVLLSGLFFSYGSYRNWPYKVESDGKYYYQFLVSLAEDGDLDFSNNYRTKKYDWMKLEIDHYKWRYSVHPHTHRPQNAFTVGLAVLWFPFYLFAKVLVFALSLFGVAEIDGNIWSRFNQYIIMFSGVVYTMAAILLSERMLREYFSEAATILSILILLFATNLVYYTTIEVSMSHVYDFAVFVFYFFLLHSIASIAHKRVGGGLYFLAGLMAGMSVLVRTQNVLSVAILALCLLLIRRNLLKMVFFSSGFTIILIPLLHVNNSLFGNPFSIPQGNSFLDVSNPNMLNVLFSLRNGLFSHHPVLFIGAVGYLLFLFKMIRLRNPLALLWTGLLVVFCIQLYVNSITTDWWAGHAFGQRRLIGVYLLFAFGFAQVFDRLVCSKRAMITGGIIVGICIVLNMYLMNIHIFLWSYNEPHNILSWMFRQVPSLILQKLGF